MGCCAQYHGENGVYGYKPSQERPFEVPREYLQERGQQSNFYRLVSAYRSHGHKQADIDPVSLGSVSSASAAKELQPNSYGLNLTDTVRFKGILFARRNEGTVGEAVSFLNSVYCGTVGTEFAHLETEEEREWFAETTERELTEALDDETRRAIAVEMLKSQAFDNFLAKKFVSLKRQRGAADSRRAAPWSHQSFDRSAEVSTAEVISQAARTVRVFGGVQEHHRGCD